jgi:uncharacterized membrane protein YfcA
MNVVGYIASFFIGLTLGLLGGGGSILTVPVLVYLFSIEPVLATSYSLFIVGTTSLTGVITKIRQKQVDWSAAFVFGLPSLLVVFLTRKFILPAIPHVLFTLGGLDITRPKFLLLLFAALMILAAFRMIREKKIHAGEDDEPASPPNRPMLVILGAVVGLLAGLVGAGGGFLIIPALVLFAGMSMKKAVGTSLLVIATNSLIGVVGDLEESYHMDWPFLLTLTAIAVAGILIGNVMSHRFSSKSLKRAFGWLVLGMGVWILVKEVFF